MKKEDILKLVNLNVRDVEAFGGTVKIRNLTIKEMLKFSGFDGEESMLEMAAMCMVEPKMTAKELGSLGTDSLNEVVKIIEALNLQDDSGK